MPHTKVRSRLSLSCCTGFHSVTLFESVRRHNFRIAALITCHNRLELTASCIRGLKASRVENVRLDVFLTDDGSTDGTSTQVRSEFPDVTLIPADGSLFWCRGMELAWRTALKHRYDSYLLVNDDVELDDDAVARLHEIANRAKAARTEPSIIVASLKDPVTGSISYGGYQRTSKWHPARLRLVQPDPVRTIDVDTFNGNLVYVPSSVVTKVGIVDPVFSHATGDIDYGFRAKKAGISIVLAPGTFGSCRRNQSVTQDLRAIFGRKGLPLRDWLVFTRRHSARGTWLFAFSGPYVKALARRKWRWW